MMAGIGYLRNRSGNMPVAVLPQIQTATPRSLSGMTLRLNWIGHATTARFSTSIYGVVWEYAVEFEWRLDT